jgi:hypothetical protein
MDRRNCRYVDDHCLCAASRQNMGGQKCARNLVANVRLFYDWIDMLADLWRAASIDTNNRRQYRYVSFGDCRDRHENPLGLTAGWINCLRLDQKKRLMFAHEPFEFGRACGIRTCDQRIKSRFLRVFLQSQENHFTAFRYEIQGITITTSRLTIYEH